VKFLLVAGARPDYMKIAFKAGRTPKGRIPELWDGRAAERIVEILARDH